MNFSAKDYAVAFWFVTAFFIFDAAVTAYSLVLHGFGGFSTFFKQNKGSLCFMFIYLIGIYPSYQLKVRKMKGNTPQ